VGIDKRSLSMDIISGLLVAASVVKGMVTLRYVDESGNRIKRTFPRGRYSTRAFQRHIGKRFGIELEWGSGSRQKIVRLFMEDSPAFDL